jgi:hypothetical protein
MASQRGQPGANGAAGAEKAINTNTLGSEGVVSHVRMEVTLPHHRQYIVVFVTLRVLQVLFSVVVLATVAALMTADGADDDQPTCDLFRTFSYPSYGNNPNFNFQDSASVNGNMAACRFGVAVAVLGLVAGLVFLLDGVLLMQRRVPPMGRSPWVYLTEWFTYLAMMALWCVNAIYLALGYISSCNGTTCFVPGNEDTFATQQMALVGVIFSWLSLVPWSCDFGLVTREYFRRLRYTQQLKEHEGRELEKAGSESGSERTNPTDTIGRGNA